MPTDDEELDKLLQDFSSLFQDMPPAPSLPNLMYGIGIADHKATALIIQTDKGSIKIEGTGEVTLPEGCTPSEAAKEFWKYIHIHGSQREEELFNANQACSKLIKELEHGINERNNAICRLQAELDNLKGNGKKPPDINRFEDLEDDYGGNKDDQGNKS